MEQVSLSKEMALIIERAYRLFQRYPVPQKFDICTSCCVSQEDEQALYHTPVRKLSFRLMNEYSWSAKEQEQRPDEVRYLLPRLLELIAHGEYPGISEEICLERVGRAEPDSWLPEERQLLVDFAHQLLNDLLDNAESSSTLEWLDTLLAMFHHGGFDIPALLTLISQRPGYYSIASLAVYLVTERDGGCVTNPFISNDQQLNTAINQWIEQNKQRLSELATAAIESEPTTLTNDMYYSGATLQYWIDHSLSIMKYGLT